MNRKNGKNNILGKGKSISWTIFSVFVIFMIIISYMNYEYDTIIKTKYDQYTIDNELEQDQEDIIVDEDSQEYLDMVTTIYQKYLDNGSQVDLRLLLATFLISDTYTPFLYDNISESDIHTVFKCMNSNPNIKDFDKITYDEKSFRKNIIDEWFKKGKLKEITKNFTDQDFEIIVNDIYDSYSSFNEILGENEISNTSMEGGVCTYKINNKTYSNIKVKLLKCEGSSYINEDPYDLETYITGVIAQEVGETDIAVMKTQSVVARSFALRRPSIMGKKNKFGIELTDDGILSLRSCTNDQVFCNPDKGCWSNRRGGQTSDRNRADWPNCTVYSGEDKSKTWSKPPLSENSTIRTAVKETYGQVAVDSSGDIVYTDFTDTNQRYWKQLAKQGKDYFEIIKKDYPNVASITSSCTAGADTELARQALTWKQDDSRWGSQLIGTKTIAKVGCMVTATSIQIARSGTELKRNDFNPGVFVSTVKANNGFSGNNFNVDDSTWASIAPNFKKVGLITFKSSDSLTTRLNKMSSLISQGYYVIAKINHPGDHWVAIINVQNSTATMADPASDSTDFCGKYNCDGNNISKIYYFKAN